MNYIWIILVFASLISCSVTHPWTDQISHESALNTSSRYRRQSICPQNRWTCGDGQCIDKYEVCDGQKNCRNGADETEDICRNIRCVPFAYRCAYGACVRSDVRCNGVNDCADGSDENLPECKGQGASVTTRPAGGCRRTEFQCKNGQCISRTMTCDGAPNCSDASDETAEECSAAQCFPYVFRCNYGACVPMSAKCNGVRDCVDGSDEEPRLCGTSSITNRPSVPRPTTTNSPFNFPPNNDNSCTIPNIQNAIITIASNNRRVALGTTVPNYSVLKYECSQSLLNNGDPDGTCLDGELKGLPKCSRFCKFRETNTYTRKCVLDDKNINCGDSVPSGTIVEQVCNKEYQPSSHFRIQQCLDSGEFDLALTPCVPICGLPVSHALPFVVNGESAKTGEFPWHAAIYLEDSNSKHEQICGGSIINAVTVISAAHCFYKVQNGEERLRPKEQFSIGVGKLNRDYNALEHQAQFSRIRELHIPDDYAGIQGNYADDIAILILEVALNFGPLVRPVCLDWTSRILSSDVQETGIVAGWGLTTEHGKPSETLQWIALPRVSKQECREQSPIDFIPFLVKDKFCAGFLNGSSVCQGDSGGGLSFPRKENQQTVYYLKGIVSVGPNSNNTCNSRKYTAFTNIQEHLEWLQRKGANRGLL